MREHDFFDAPSAGGARRRRRFDDDEPRSLEPRRRGTRLIEDTADDEPDEGDGWSSWGTAGVMHGPKPFPDWVITDLGAVDTDRGVLKTGKEADVHLVERSLPGTGRTLLLAAKRYRSSQHRMFHRDAGYLDGRRVRASRVNRAMANRTAFGREAIAGQWAQAEFAALSRLHQLGVSVPYPVQLLETELMLEFLGTPDGAAAPRLAQLRPSTGELEDLWRQLTDALDILARAGLTHGDLSPYNILVHCGRLVLIDLPQIVDVVGNPAGPEFLARDVAVVAKWFASRGLVLDPDTLTRQLLSDAGIR